MLNLGKFRENLIFCQVFQVYFKYIQSSNLKTLLHIWDAYYICDYLPHTAFHFYLKGSSSAEKKKCLLLTKIKVYTCFLCEI